MTARLSLPSALVLGALVLAGCMTPEQRMALKVEGMMERQQYEGALRYLETYLVRHNKSLNGWRYRVLIRLEQGARGDAALEYVALNEALSRHEPEVLREVVLGGGGRWLLSDYRALARCAPKGVADPAFFANLVEPKHLSAGSMSKVAVGADEIAAVVEALPGRLTASETWPIVYRFAERATPELAVRLVGAASRHLVTGGLTVTQSKEALDLLVGAAGAGEVALREAALLGAQSLPGGEGVEAFAASIVGGLLAAGDLDRALSAVLLGPQGKGPAAWSPETLSGWAETAVEPVRVLAIGALMAGGDADKARMALLDRAASGEDVAGRLAAVVAGSLVSGWKKAPDLAATWGALDVEDRRHWGPVFVRSAAPDAGAWAIATLTDSDAVVGEASAIALGLPSAVSNEAVEAALGKAMESQDPSTRASAAAAAVIRGADSLGNPVGALLAGGDDRATELVLIALRDTGRTGWDAATKLGMDSPVPTIRELAVDAAVATCDPGRTEQMFDLLADEDPHVAVRAASALYLLIGGEK